MTAVCRCRDGPSGSIGADDDEVERAGSSSPGPAPSTRRAPGRSFGSSHAHRHSSRSQARRGGRSARQEGRSRETAESRRRRQTAGSTSPRVTEVQAVTRSEGWRCRDRSYPEMTGRPVESVARLAGAVITPLQGVAGCRRGRHRNRALRRAARSLLGRRTRPRRRRRRGRPAGSGCGPPRRWRRSRRGGAMVTGVGIMAGTRRPR